MFQNKKIPHVIVKISLRFFSERFFFLFSFPFSSLWFQETFSSSFSSFSSCRIPLSLFYPILPILSHPSFSNLLSLSFSLFKCSFPPFNLTFPFYLLRGCYHGDFIFFFKLYRVFLSFFFLFF